MRFLVFIQFIFFQIFPGNNDRYTPVSHDLKIPIITRYIRINPETWHSHICMRAEFYGCREGENIQRQPFAFMQSKDGNIVIFS